MKDDMKLIHSSNIGDIVICDGCNADGKESNGGAIIGSSAYCGKCCEKYGYDKKDYKYADEIDEIMDKSKTFQQNVLGFRKRMTGSSDGITRMYTWGDSSQTEKESHNENDDKPYHSANGEEFNSIN